MPEVPRPALRDELISKRVALELEALTGGATRKEKLETGEAARRISQYLERVAETVFSGLPDSERLERGAEIANLVLAQLDPQAQLLVPPELLTGVMTGDSQSENLWPKRPRIPLSASDLIVNGVGQPTLGSELRLELESAESVDLICAFVIWSGVRVLKEQLKALIDRQGQLRVVTTTYMGATEPRALEELVKLGAEIRIAFDARSTKLHAKSWLIERPNGLTTAFVGSSNLSHTALLDGLEWNVRLADADNPSLVSRIRDTFEVHWNDKHFEPFDPERDRDRLRRALGEGERRRLGDKGVSFANLDVNPYPHQRLMLDTLEVERKRHDRHRNLLVAATGTGKTVVAALDYRRLLADSDGELPLLFVAHRRQILEQAMTTYRAVLRDGNFGQLLGDGEEPTDWKHVFAMVQSLGAEQLERLNPDDFDVVVIDEFHHAAADSYDRVLQRLTPKELLGMTATPERLDGKDVTTWFGGRIAVELRLWEAIDQGFLSPFQYFGVSDGVDLSDLDWRNGGYATADLENVYTGNDARVAKLLRAIDDVVEEPQEMKALGFCVSVAHAQYMAHKFTEAGLESLAVSGATPTDERASALRKLASGDLRVIFSVDVFGEGVDVPAVDTLLLLRPTQSGTVVTQQLGRGLRRAEGKRCLTVLDLIGQQHRRFRFEERLAPLIDRSQGSVQRQTEDGFPFLPPGCEINLDRVSEEIVLANLREGARFGQWRNLIDDLSGMGASASMGQFLDQTGRSLDDLYRRPGQSWVRLRSDARVGPALEGGDEETSLLKAVGRIIHADDRERTDFLRRILAGSAPPTFTDADPREQRLLAMLHFSIWGVTRKFESFDDGFERLWSHPRVTDELRALVEELDARSTSLTHPLGLNPSIPVMTHGVYSRDEVLAAFGIGTATKPPQLREGVRWCEEEKTDLFFVTLNKSESDYSPTTMYRDFAISPELFHWESQSLTAERSPTGQRYVNHAREGSSVVIFVRDSAKTSRSTTSPYTCLGQATYVEHRGEKPMAITWKLRAAMPERLFESARAVAA